MRSTIGTRPPLGEIDTTNPCGEQPLLPYESCVLGSINLAACMDNGILDENKLRETARMATRFLDLVIERNVFPIPQIAEATRKPGRSASASWVSTMHS